MEGDDSDDNTPPASSSSPTAWSFHDARTGASPPPSAQRRPERSLHSRTNSLPRALYSSGSTSIFGGTTSSRLSNMQSQQEDTTSNRPPTLAVNPPSQDRVPVLQPALSTLPGPSMRQRESWYIGDEDDAVAEGREIPQVEKSTDDVDAPPSSSRAGPNRRESTTLTTLSRLFAVQAATSPEASRSPSYVQQSKPHVSSYSRNLQFGEAAPLPDHLYSRGLLEGRHSDITVRAFGQEYRLHRIILDRAPFFRSALSEPWLESNAKETTVHPEDIDSSITQASFELALKRLYGCNDPSEESGDAVGLFATGCWLEMQDLIQSSIDSMLRQMSPPRLAPLIKLVTSNYYGRAGDKILSSAKAMLCRDGWHMPTRYWDGIPGDIVREIVGGDGFFIDGEWERWDLAKRILDRRLKLRAIESGLVQPGSKRKILKAPEYAATNLTAIRFDSIHRRHNTSARVGDPLQPWISLYTHPDIEPLLVLLDEGIHYIHLDFEQLQFIKNAKDIVGLPVLPEKVVSDALWAQMELRQRVLNAKEGEMDLGISVVSSAADFAGSDEASGIHGENMSSMPAAFDDRREDAADVKGKHKATDSEDSTASVHKSTEDHDTIIESGSWDGNGKPRKFWIPTSDCNIFCGNADPVIATSNNTTLQRHANRLSGNGGPVQPEDIMWASDFAAVTSQPRLATVNPTSEGNTTGLGISDASPSSFSTETAGEVRYTHFPPFRFSAEFENPRLLKEKKRVYSRTVFYAGSLWNIYIQKVNSSRSKQLGVYLHRAKERDAEDVIAGIAGLSGSMPASSSVPGSTVDERIGMLEREMILRSERRDHQRNEESTADHDTRPSIVRSLLDGRPRQRPDRTDSDTDSDTDTPTPAPPPTHLPTLPPYVDARPTIKTYFKIYSPSRGGRMLSVYESAPDCFNFSQSWGWKSSTLMLDEGLGEDDLGEGGGGGGGEGKLRFMVVLGDI